MCNEVHGQRLIDKPSDYISSDGPHVPQGPLYVSVTAVFCLFMECSRSARMLQFQDTFLDLHGGLFRTIGLQT